ncbi:DUF1840 domain-containing protein [Hydrogenophaga sp.]|uniref:DUF1840 domain-containing protein n=1 Tax=Hydrogenophaga sp. TaxID=1904254 RepID=UPI003565C9A4
MSLYRFKSRETGDLVMLEPHGKRILQLLGKEPSGPGILEVAQMSAAVTTLREAIVLEEAEHKRLVEEALAKGEEAPMFDPVGLRMRCAPFIEMVQRCEGAKVDIVWGV